MSNQIEWNAQTYEWTVRAEDGTFLGRTTDKVLDECSRRELDQFFADGTVPRGTSPG